MKAPGESTETGGLDSGRCVSCGADLMETVVEGSCPSCGEAVVRSFSMNEAPWLPVSRVAVWSMVVGIASVGGCMLHAGVPLGLAAMVMSVAPRGAIKRGEVSVASKTYAKAGRSLGFTAVVLGAVYWWA